MAQWYRQALAKFLNKEADWDSDSIVITLHTSTYAFNLDTNAYVSDLTNELSTGGGYTAGGVTLTSVTKTYTAANSFGTSAATSTAYAVGAVVRPSVGNGFLYRCTVAGTSGASAPSWGAVVGGSTTDGTVTWENVGAGIIQLTAASPSWASPFTAGPFRVAVISDRTPGTAATQPLIGLIDFGSDQTGGGGALQINFSTLGVLAVFTP